MHFNLDEVKEIVREVWNFPRTVGSNVDTHTELLQRISIICKTKIVLKYATRFINADSLISVADLHHVLNVVANLKFSDIM